MEHGVGSWTGRVVDDVVVAMQCSTGTGRGVCRDRQLDGRPAARPQTAGLVEQLAK